MSIWQRVWLVTASQTLGFLLVSVSCFNSRDPQFFFLALLACLFVGLSQSVGEASFLGFLKQYPSHFVGFASSGTGFAGIAGTLLILFLNQAMAIDYAWIYLWTAPLFALFIVSFNWLCCHPYPLSSEQLLQAFQNQSLLGTETNPALADGEGPSRRAAKNTGLAARGNSLSLSGMRQGLRKEGGLIANLFCVYFFEYCIFGCFADRMALAMRHKYPERADSLEVKQFFTVLNNSYQVGVFLSRSSLQCFQVRRVSIFTLFQALNFALMLLNTRYMWVESLQILSLLFVWVGLMGGASYVNVFKLMLDSERLEEKEKEVAVVTSLVFNDLGVLLASLFTLAADNSFLRSTG
uniref:Battenin n=1 Tax=Strombidium rassoulzadegani TaxID=1082188 RepID=A0A7S3CKN5_9SPIT|mmetsp:Transcript_1471/g.2583  ORF Transcript_1471/g.2583 Transcript_1471/m.2583 type:complete len:351 (+) Transcript_1471:488-1540(+)